MGRASFIIYKKKNSKPCVFVHIGHSGGKQHEKFQSDGNVWAITTGYFHGNIM